MRIVDATGWEPSAWDDLAVRSPMGEAFQSHAWGELKRGLGWTPLRYVIEFEATPIAVVSVQERAGLGRRGGPLGRYRIHYAPRGPVLLDSSRDAAQAAEAALEGLRSIARARRSVAFTIDPAWEEGSGLATALGRAGFRPARREIQVSRTAMVVPLEATDDAQHALLADSTARNINKARRAGVTSELVDLTDSAAREAALDRLALVRHLLLPPEQIDAALRRVPLADLRRLLMAVQHLAAKDLPRIGEGRLRLAGGGYSKSNAGSNTANRLISPR